MTRLSVALAAAACVAGLCPVAPTPAQAQVAAAAQGVAYNAGDVHLASSSVLVHVGKTGLGHEHAVVGAIQRGRLALGSPKDAGEVVFDLASFRADTPQGRRALKLEGESSESTRSQVTANMLGPDVLDVARSPVAVFRVESALPHPTPSARGLAQHELVGQLTLHGATRPVRFLVEVESQNGWRRVRGGLTLRQTDYGIKPFTKAFGAIGVADEVRVWGDLWVAASAGVARAQAAPAR